MRFNKMFLMALGVALAASGSHASAAETKFGLKAGLAFPTGNLKDDLGAKPRFQGGMLVHFDLGRGNAIRAQLDHTRFTRSQSTTLVGLAADETFRVSCTSLGADYVRYLSKDSANGPYLFAGIGLSANRLDVDWTLRSQLAQGGVNVAHTSVRRYGNVGFGYQFNENFGLEAGYRHSTLGGGDGVVSANRSNGAISRSGSSNFHMDSSSLGYWSLAATWRF